jgi:hypothetical protein
MSCHRVRRALLWMTRFGEFGPDSQLHLDHLSGCRACRDEVGCDRETVRLLRAALAARVDGMEPSSGVWEQVRALAQQPEPARSRWPWRRASDVMAIGRSLTAMAGTGLALVLAMNTQIVTVTLPQPDGASSPLAVSEGVGAPSAWDRLPRLVPAGGGSAADEAPPMDLNAPPDPEGLVMNVDAGQVLASMTSPATEEPAHEPQTEVVVLVRLPLAPEPPPADSHRDEGAERDGGGVPDASPLPAGAPT